jgi:hypothetical protein
LALLFVVGIYFAPKPTTAAFMSFVDHRAAQVEAVMAHMVSDMFAGLEQRQSDAKAARQGN